MHGFGPPHRPQAGRSGGRVAKSVGPARSLLPATGCAVREDGPEVLEFLLRVRSWNSMSIGVLFVCLGNICRSPTAHGVFQHMVDQAGLADRIRIDSAGTQDYHPGKPPDPRSMRAARRRGYDLGSLRARQVRQRDFTEFDYLLAMDGDNHQDLLQLCPPDKLDRVHMLLSFAEGLGVDSVPDPYYGPGEEGFEQVLDLVEVACAGLLTRLRRELSA